MFNLKLIVRFNPANRALYLSEVDVHPIVAVNEMAVVRLAVLELHQHGMILRCAQQRQRQHYM